MGCTQQEYLPSKETGILIIILYKNINNNNIVSIACVFVKRI